MLSKSVRKRKIDINKTPSKRSTQEFTDLQSIDKKRKTTPSRRSQNNFDPNAPAKILTRRFPVLEDHSDQDSDVFPDKTAFETDAATSQHGLDLSRTDVVRRHHSDKQGCSLNGNTVGFRPSISADDDSTLFEDSEGPAVTTLPHALSAFPRLSSKCFTKSTKPEENDPLNCSLGAHFIRNGFLPDLERSLSKEEITSNPRSSVNSFHGLKQMSPDISREDSHPFTDIGYDTPPMRSPRTSSPHTLSPVLQSSTGGVTTPRGRDYANNRTGTPEGRRWRLSESPVEPGAPKRINRSRWLDHVLNSRMDLLEPLDISDLVKTHVCAEWITWKIQTFDSNDTQRPAAKFDIASIVGLSSSLPEVQASEYSQLPPLFLAVRYSSAKVVQYLISQGADCRQLNQCGQNLLAALCSQPASSPHAVHALIDNGHYCPSLLRSFKLRHFPGTSQFSSGFPLDSDVAAKEMRAETTIGAASNFLKWENDKCGCEGVCICDIGPVDDLPPDGGIPPEENHEEEAQLHELRNREMAAIAELLLLENISPLAKDLFDLSAVDYARIFNHVAILDLFESASTMRKGNSLESAKVLHLQSNSIGLPLDGLGKAGGEPTMGIGRESNYGDHGEARTPERRARGIEVQDEMHRSIRTPSGKNSRRAEVDDSNSPLSEYSVVSLNSCFPTGYTVGSRATKRRGSRLSSKFGLEEHRESHYDCGEPSGEFQNAPDHKVQQNFHATSTAS